MTAAHDPSRRARSVWPEHISLRTEPVEQRRRVTAQTPQVRQAPHAQQPRSQPARSQQSRPATSERRTLPAPSRPHGALTRPQLRRRWLGGIASAVLIGATLPVQLGAVAIESLELLSPGPDGSAMTVVLTAIAVQLVVLLLPMLAGPAIGGFTRRWRARLMVLGGNAILVAGIALVGWLRISQP